LDDRGEAKIEDLHLAVRSDLDVGGLEVAMDDPLFVCRFERLGHLPRDRQRRAHHQRAAGNQISKRVPFNEFKNDRGDRRV